MNAVHEMSVPVINEKIAQSPGRQILLADDDPAIRQMLFRLLMERNYRVLTARNGVEALGIADTTKLDLVLLDLNMPIKNGWETFEQLSTKNPLLPIILITAQSDQFCFAQAAGVGALLEKPLDFEKLFHTIHNLLEEPAVASLARYTGRHSMFRYARPATEEPSDLAQTAVPEWGAN